MTEVCCAGDLYLDILTSPIKRIVSETIEEGEVFTSVGGNASNTAVALASLGIKTALFCAISEDMFGKMLESEIRRRGIRLFASNKKTPQAITVGLNFASGKRYFFGNKNKSNMLFSPKDVGKENIQGKVFFSGGFWFTPLLWKGLEGIFSHARKKGMINCMDICWDHEGFPNHKTEALFSLLPFVDYLFLNPAELRGICKMSLSHSLKMTLKTGVKNIVLHQGARGASLINEKTKISSPAFKTGIKNPTGTGDVFNAGFVYGLLRGFSQKECLRAGNACASLHLGGKSYPSLNHVKRLL